MTALESTEGLTDPKSLHSKGRVLFDLLALKKKSGLEVFSLHSPSGRIEHTQLVFSLNEVLGKYASLLQNDGLACARVMDLGGIVTAHLFERVEVRNGLNVFELRSSFSLGPVPEIIPKAPRRPSLLSQIYAKGQWD